jgi:two-component system, OmpR family, phosphate regulon sensor histidine kinase PhoR
MNWFEVGLVILLVCVIAWLGWRAFRLRSRLRKYSGFIRAAAVDDIPLEKIPEDEKGFEDLSNAVRDLVEALNDKLKVQAKESARLSAVLERMTDGVLIADGEGRIQFANPAAERLFEMVPATSHSVAEVLRQHQLVETWQHSRETGEPQEESLEIPASHQYIHLVVLPYHESGGSLLLVQDLTRVRRLETVRRDFISNVSHELRTPLASLKALTETLQDGALADPEAAKRFLSRIETEVDALSQMTAELLELTRIESGQVSLKIQNTPAAQLLSSAADRMRAQAERAGLELTVSIQAQAGKVPPLMVKADPSRLDQVFVNLIHNSIKFTQPGGEIDLSLHPEGGFVQFSIKDNGAGIPQEDLERIFERFYKADRARSGGGTGLGLSIARHIVEAHGGRIWVESVERRGSTFFFTIPVA